MGGCFSRTLQLDPEQQPLLPASTRCQTSSISGPANPGEGKARRSVRFIEAGLATLPPASDTASVANLHENFIRGHIQSDNGARPYLGYRGMATGKPGPYQWITYQQAYLRIKNLGSGLAQYGARFGSNIGLFAINRPEWVIAEHACYMYGYVTVPLYDTLGADAIEYILKLADVPIIVATADKAKIVLNISYKLPLLKHIIVMDAVPRALKEQARTCNVELVHMRETEAIGREVPITKAQTNSDTVATICFTSGTTGQPKGVVITHGNLLSFIASVCQMQNSGVITKFTSNETHLSYLPLAHIFERIIQVAITFYGGRIGFYQGDTLKLMEDIEALRPTIFVSVPRLYNRIYDKVLSGVKLKGGISEYLFNRAFEAKRLGLLKGTVKHTFWDLLVFSKIRQKLGGRVRLMMSGAAPIGDHVVDFMRICFSASFIEGYGQTETTGAATATELGDFSTGHVGVPIPSSIVKLRDVPSMNYFSSDTPYPRGEICIKGTNVFKGYYKAPDKTEETLSSDGWCYTGDIGMWDEAGRLKIIDRVKNIFKLAQGEYIAPEKIEMVYQRHEAVFQSFVFGDSLQSFLVGVIVVDEATFIPWAHSLGFIETSLTALCEKQEVKNAVQKSLDIFGKQHGLQSFENVKSVFLETAPFTAENGLMTPTFKYIRHAILKLYQMEIDLMYSSLVQSA